MPGMARDDSPFPWTRFLAPRYWPVWLVLGLLRFSAWLPYGAQLWVGRVLGRPLRWLLPDLRRYADINVAMCFPELDDDARRELVNGHFAALVTGVIEGANCWWASNERLRKLVRAEGLEHLRAAQAAGRPVILLSGHFTTLEIGGRLLGLFVPFSLMYRPNKHPLLEEVIRRNRLRHFDDAIPRDSVKRMLKTLQSGRSVWYAPDQSYRKQQGISAPFFGVPAPTTTATSRIARATGALVMPFVVTRLPGKEGYLLTIEPPLEDFPTDDIEADTARVNAAIEAAVRRAPEQYIWIHRRFKALPGEPNPYA